MGYSTDFDGSLSFSRELTDAEVNEVNDFANERHEEEHYPSYYCQWIIEEHNITRDGVKKEQVLTWDCGEKFYSYVEWLEYLIKHFFVKWGVLLNGEIEWQGEEMSDRGLIAVKDNKIKIKKIKYVDYDDE